MQTKLFLSRRNRHFNKIQPYLFGFATRLCRGANSLLVVSWDISIRCSYVVQDQSLSNGFAVTYPDM